MKRFRRLVTVVGVMTVLPAAVFLLQCSSSEPEGHDPTTTCDQAQLNLADPAESTVKLYLDTATEATDKLTKLGARFKDICNAVNKDMGEPEGADIHAACNNIAAHIIAANAAAPIPDGGAPPPIWATTLFDNTCALDGKAAGDCLDTCSAKKGCDSVATCPKGKAAGKCSGACSTCATAGDAVPCTGGCGGECTFPADQDGGPACQGECRGTCSAPTWLASCSTGCGAGFRGTCDGTCTGACNGMPYPGVDGGEPDAAGVDAGDGGGEAGGPVTAPGSGTCSGVCTGSCVGKASGTCAAPCKGDFTGGACTGQCVGICNGVNVACVTSCKGTCVTRGACAAACVGSCDKPLENAKCGATPECDEPNDICKSTCTLKSALNTTCKPTTIDIRIAGDYKLPFALRAHAAEFTAAAREAALIANTLGGVLQRPSGDFAQIGVIRDNARACAAGATTAYDNVRKLANEAAGASLVVKGLKF